MPLSRLAAAVLLLLLPAHAQLPGLPLPGAKTGEKTQTPEDTPARLKQWQTEARAELARVDDPAAEASLPPGITAELLADHRRNLDDLTRTTGRVLTLLDAVSNAAETLEAARAATRDWRAFDTPPPYSLLLVDDLETRRSAALDKNATYRSSITLYQRSLATLDANAREIAARRQNLQAIPADDPAHAAALWQLDAAETSARLTSARAEETRANIRLLEHQSSTAREQITLLDRQIAAASPKAALTDDDIEQLRASSQTRVAALRKEITDIRNQLRSVSAARTKLKTEFDTLAAQADPPAPADQLALASALLSTADIRADALQSISKNLESLEILETATPEIYALRQSYLHAPTRQQRRETLDSLRDALARIRAWQDVSTNELSAVAADLASHSANSAAPDLSDAMRRTLNERRDVLLQKQAVLQRIVQSASATRKLLDRWVSGFEEDGRPKTWSSWFSSGAAKAWEAVSRVWTSKPFSVETTTTDAFGNQQTYRQGIELGLILSALLFFIVAYAVASRLTRRMQRIVVTRGRLAEAQANTLRKWLMILIGVLLALTALHLVKIPLTVFAFVGGALAIGLGFGTQTLIKNFISGIIVLFERKIRVGDIVEVGALSGSIAEINTRSSVLRGGDGRETLIPNSIFLENSVTNLTLSNRISRRTVQLAVAFGVQPPRVSAILMECAERHGLILKEPPPLVILQDFTDSTLVFKLYFWTAFDGKTNAELVESDIRTMILKRFEEAGIPIFPQRDLNLNLNPAAPPLRVECTPPDAGS